MQLNNLESAWKQLKLSNAMQPIEPKEILAIIEMTEQVNRTKLVLLNLVMFIMITICCQGG
jgi:hypothetical protein